MDDSDVERIVISVEHKYGQSRTEYMANSKLYRQHILDDFMYRKHREQGEGRIHVTDKQDAKLKLGFKAYLRYGKVTPQTLKAIKSLIIKGKVKKN